MHIEGMAYDKKTLKPLYGKLSPSAKRKEIVLGDAYGFKTRYNILLRLFHENIAQSAENLDAIRGGLVNLRAYSHEVFVSGEEAEVEPIDVMEFIYKEMYDTVITKKKTLVYASYVMLLLIVQHIEHPLLTSHKYVKPQRKASSGVVEEVFASSDEGEEVDEEEESVDVAPRSGPRIKNASNAFVPSSCVEIKANMKKLSWWERYILCMNVDIDKKLHSQYVRNKHIQRDQRRIMDRLDIPKNNDEDQISSSTLSYNAWNSKSLVNWQDFEEVTGPSHGRASPDVEESKAKEEEEEEYGENSDENEDSDEE
jgi:hypothetical protein